MEILFRNKDEMVQESIVDMLRSLILVFGEGREISNIFSLNIKFIDEQLKEQGVSNNILSLWYFMVKEYSGVQNLDTQMMALFQNYIPSITSSNSP